MSPWNSCKAMFARFWAAADRETRFSSSRRLRFQADLSGRLEPKRGLSGSEAYGCPPGTAAKRCLPGSGPPLTARLASRAVEGCVFKLICLVAWSQNEVYPVRRLTNVPPGTAAKRGLPGSGPPLTPRLASPAVEGCVLKLICLVAWSQNEVYPVRRLTNVPPGNSRKARFAR